VIGGNGNSSIASSTEIASNGEIIHLVAMVKVTASGNSNHNSRCKGNNQPGVRRNYTSMWETVQQLVMVMVIQQQI